MATTEITGAEGVFLAGNNHVEISPEFDHPQLQLLSGSYGPFRSYEKIQVPLWLAVHLKKQQKCKISWPLWLEPDSLDEKIAAEKSSQTFTDVPFYYGEVAKMILDNFSDDHPESRKIRSLVNDLQTIRHDRINVGLKQMAGAAARGDYDGLQIVRLPNASAVDLLPTKGVICKSLDAFFKMYSEEDEDDLDGDDDDDDADDRRGSSRRISNSRRLRRTRLRANSDIDSGDDEGEN